MVWIYKPSQLYQSTFTVQKKFIKIIHIKNKFKKYNYKWDIEFFSISHLYNLFFCLRNSLPILSELGGCFACYFFKQFTKIEIIPVAHLFTNFKYRNIGFF